MKFISPFHAAFPVTDLNQAIDFYKNILDCKQGRSDKTWVDFDFFGHQLVFHYVENFKQKHYFNPVDKHKVPVPHFGAVLEWEEWHNLKRNLLKNKIEFIIEPYIRFKNKPGEQATMFFLDPNGYALEFKSFKDINNLFMS